MRKRVVVVIVAVAAVVGLFFVIIIISALPNACREEGDPPAFAIPRQPCQPLPFVSLPSALIFTSLNLSPSTPGDHSQLPL